MTPATSKSGARLGRVQGKALALEGAKAVAYAMRQINPDVVAAYPITPQTDIVQTFSEYVAEGLVDTEFIAVESEHAAMSACVGAAAAGGRVQTATTSVGLAFMWEVLYIAAATRLPIIMHFVNRALSAPVSIHCDYSDSMGARDAGWIQIYAETAQEAYDNALQSMRIAEHPDVLLPVMHTQDGFITSHSLERVQVLPDDAAKAFIGTYEPRYSVLDLEHPITFGALDLQEYYFEHKRQQIEAMDKALEAIKEIGREFGDLTGRHYGLIDAYQLDDADFAVVAMGSTAGTTREVVNDLREEGIKAGMLRVRSFRPFPAKEIAEALRGRKFVAVLDRSVSFGAEAQPLFAEVASALYSYEVPTKAVNYIYGLGGKDMDPSTLRKLYDELHEMSLVGRVEPGKRYIGLRE